MAKPRTTPRSHLETHKSHRAGWLRAGVLGANDGIVSTACLVLGVASADADGQAAVVAGVAGLVAGALSMAVGELVSVGSQRDVENADIAREKHELATDPAHELAELTQIFEAKGLSNALAHEVAVELMRNDALAVHLREELGITEETRARPVQAAVGSAVAFAVGAALPLSAIAFSPTGIRSWSTAVVSVVALSFLGALSARLGGAPVLPALGRVVVGGIVAMALTIGIGAMLGTSVG